MYKQRKKQNSDRIHSVPLVIDDEADNASIQSMSKKEYEIWGEGQKVSNIDFEDLTAAQEETLKRLRQNN